MIKVIIKRKKNKKGFTIIELVLFLFIAALLTSTTTQLFNIIVGKFKEEITLSKNDFYINEAFRYIETEVNRDTRKISAVNNSIILEKFKKQQSGNEDINYIELDLLSVDINRIELEGGDLVVRYLGRSNTPNNILRNVSYFNATINGKVIIVNIRMGNGKCYEKCLSLRYIET